MHRIIAVVVAIAAVALAAALVEAFARLPGSPATGQVLLFALFALLIVVFVWVLLARSIRAWRRPSAESLRKLYGAFGLVVFFATFGVLSALVAGAGDFVEVVVPIACAAVVAVAVDYALLRSIRRPAER